MLFSVSLFGLQIHLAAAFIGLTALLGLRYLVNSYLLYRRYWLHDDLGGAKIQNDPAPLKIDQAIKWSLLSQPVIAAVILYVWFMSEKNLNLVYYRLDEYGYPYLVVGPVLFVVGHEIFHYGMHRFQHRNSWFFREIHGVHHRFRTPTPFTEVAFHPLDALLHTIYLPLALHILPQNVFLIGLYVCYLGVVNSYGHLGFELFPKVPFFLANVTSHDIHHTRPTKNFGLHTTIPDRILGTYWSATKAPSRDSTHKETAA